LALQSHGEVPPQAFSKNTVLMVKKKVTVGRLKFILFFHKETKII
jgi:hypothetical protein